MITTLHMGGTAKWLQYYIGGGMPKWLQYYMGGGSLGTPKSDYVICARPLMEKWWNVIQSVHLINIALAEEVCPTIIPPLKVFLHARDNIFFVDGDEVVPVRSHVLVNES